jgi:hypothetical protein
MIDGRAAAYEFDLLQRRVKELEFELEQKENRLRKIEKKLGLRKEMKELDW